MIKHVLLISAMAVSLTGCIVAPFDDGPGYNHSHGMNQGRPDRPHWNNRPDNGNNGQHRPNWNNKPQQRPQWNNNGAHKPVQRPNGNNDHSRPR